MSKSAAEAARSVTEVSGSIQDLNKATNESSAGLQQVYVTTEDLAKIASLVQQEVNKFKIVDTDTNV